MALGIENIYVSNFGPATSVDSNTVVYKIDRNDLSVSVFCDGFIGASGSCFDSQGNFYQSNNNGNRISKILLDGTKEYDWATGLSLPVGVIADTDDNIFACNCIIIGFCLSLFDPGCIFCCCFV